MQTKFPHTVRDEFKSFTQRCGDTGFRDPSREQRKGKYQNRLNSQRGLVEEHLFLLDGLKCDRRMAKGLLFEGALNKLATCPSVRTQD